MKIKSQSIDGVSLKGKILVMKEDHLKQEYRTIGHRLHKATGGFGCEPFLMGRAIFATCLADHMDDRWNRDDFEGWVTEEEANELLKNHGRG